MKNDEVVLFFFHVFFADSTVIKGLAIQQHIMSHNRELNSNKTVGITVEIKLNLKTSGTVVFYRLTSIL